MKKRGLTGGSGNSVSTVTAVADCLSVPADNITVANITITAKATNSTAVSGKTVTIAGSPVLTGLTIQPASATTDANGQVKFTVRSSSQGGPVVFTPSIDGTAYTTSTVSITFAKIGTKCVPAPTTTTEGTSTTDGIVITRLLCIRTGPGFGYSRYAKALPFNTVVRVLGRATRVAGLGPRDNCIKKGGPTWYFVQLKNGVVVWANANFIRLATRTAFRFLPILQQPPAPGFPGAPPSGLPIGPAEPGIAPGAPAPTATPKP